MRTRIIQSHTSIILSKALRHIPFARTMSALHEAWTLLKEMVPVRARGSSSGTEGFNYGERVLPGGMVNQQNAPAVPSKWLPKTTATQPPQPTTATQPPPPTLQSIDVRPGQVCPHCGRGGTQGGQ